MIFLLFYPEHIVGRNKYVVVQLLTFQEYLTTSFCFFRSISDCLITYASLILLYPFVFFWADFGELELVLLSVYQILAQVQPSVSPRLFGIQAILVVRSEDAWSRHGRSLLLKSRFFLVSFCQRDSSIHVLYFWIQLKFFHYFQAFLALI